MSLNSITINEDGTFTVTAWGKVYKTPITEWTPPEIEQLIKILEDALKVSKTALSMSIEKNR